MTYELKETENIEKDFLSGKSVPEYNKLEYSNDAKLIYTKQMSNEIENPGRESFPLKENSSNFSNSINDEHGFSKIIPKPNINLNLYHDDPKISKRSGNNSNLTANPYGSKFPEGNFPLVEVNSPKFNEISDANNHVNREDSIKIQINNINDKKKIRKLSSIQEIHMITENNNIPDLQNKRSSNIFNCMPQGFNFDENERPIRYTKKNLDLGKNFFKNRYISQKIYLDHIPNDNTRKNYIFNFDNHQNRDNINRIYQEDKLIIKYNSLFLKQLEKGIFSFNLKKYEESYNHLIENNIIKNLEEFAELLLVVQGFDKYMVGDFLSKEKSPNKGFLVLKSFMQKFCFNQMKFVEAFRFLLSRINLPKDSSLILNIVDSFSEVYYNDNQHDYPSLNSVYLLCCTVLSLNTSCHRKIENVSPIKKEEFFKMNEKISKNILNEIYDEIYINKLDIVHQYNEMIYRRLSVKENLQNGETKTFRNLNFNNENNSSDLKLDDFLMILKKGEIFVKYGNYGNPHLRFVQLTDDEERLIWKPISSCSFFKSTHYIESTDIKDVYIGNTNSKIFEKYKIPLEFDRNCFSIICSERTLDLRNDEDTICRNWVRAIKYLVKRIRSMQELKKLSKINLKEISDRKEIISDIWKTEILPNWHNYRQFIMLNKRNLTISSGDKKKKIQRFNKIFDKNIKQRIDEVKFKLIDEKHRSDVIFLWILGLPDWLRKKIWPLVIGNEIQITENLFHNYFVMVEQIDFSNIPKDLKKISSKDFSSYFDMKLANVNDILIEIVNDVLKLTRKYSEYIIRNNLDEAQFKEDLFRILRVYTLYRPDFAYGKNIAYFSTILLLNCDNYYTSFVCLMNLIIPSFLSGFQLREEKYVKLRYNFFDELFKIYLPNVYVHFKNLDISISLFIYNWIEYMFAKFFNYEMLLRLWDYYIIKGEILIYEVSLTILKIQEKDLINIPVNNILKNLKKLNSKITEEEFFNTLQEIDISEYYNLIIERNNLANEKTHLYESLL